MPANNPPSPIPIKWACGTCGGELAHFEPEILVCTNYYCPVRGVAIPVPEKASDKSA